VAASRIAKSRGKACIADAGYHAGHIRYAIKPSRPKVERTAPRGQEVSRPSA